MGRYGTCNTLCAVSRSRQVPPDAGAARARETPGLGGCPPMNIRISPTYSPNLKRVFP